MSTAESERSNFRDKLRQPLESTELSKFLNLLKEAGWNISIIEYKYNNNRLTEVNAIGKDFIIINNEESLRVIAIDQAEFEIQPPKSHSEN